jgi:hypothetical protein
MSPRISILLLTFITVISLNLSAQQLYPAQQNKKFGFIDIHGNWVIQPAFDDVDIFVDGLARVRNQMKWGFINEKGVVIVPLKYDDAKNFHEGVAPVKILDIVNNLGLFGLITKKGEWIIQPSLQKIEAFNDDGLARAKAKNGDWGMIDKTGTWIIKPTFAGLEDFHNDLAMAKGKGEWGYINRKAEWVGNQAYV